MKDAASLERMALEPGPSGSPTWSSGSSPGCAVHPPPRGRPVDAEDVLQDVFSALVEANRLLMPIEHVTGWLFRVARNRIIDLFRKRRPERLGDVVADDDTIALQLEDLLPSPDAGPEALYARSVLLDELETGDRRAARGAARRVRRPRAGRAQLQGDGRPRPA